MISGGGEVVNSVSFDYSGSYLACGTDSGAVQVKVVKEWADAAVSIT